MARTSPPTSTWDWRHRTWPEETLAIARRAARLRGLARGAVALAIAGLLHVMALDLAFKFGLTLSVLTLVTAAVRPLALDRALAALARGAGVVMTWLLLVPIFFVVLVPFGLLFRRGANDPLHRRFDPRLPSHWRAHERRGTTQGQFAP